MRLKAPTSILAESAGANSKACHPVGFFASAAPRSPTRARYMQEAHPRGRRIIPLALRQQLPPQPPGYGTRSTKLRPAPGKWPIS